MPTNLTKTQSGILSLHGAGKTPDEISDILGMKPSTVRKHLDNIKKITSWHKSTELSGYQICQFLGFSYEEVREGLIKKAIQSIPVILILLGYSGQEIYRQRSYRSRSIRINERRFSRRAGEEQEQYPNLLIFS